ncbi:MAG: flagellar basal-body MS-ring/collar protein FliF [Nitrosomonas sp.]|nr:flagellar basal-body MS-ring/collar protein FliF [Nitrosomonas sp.]MDP1949772.1 flagellar basal-body MS-ring/collar protein FliF [Nitrosomonas sp.]
MLNEPVARTRLDLLSQLSNQKKLGLMIATAAFIALITGVWMWSQTPDYRVLYSNVSDHDGGAIINSLQQMNIPYKFSQGGGAILIPGNQVHDVRLRLASQGLPKGGLAGFELMENQKFGSSQFLEQINYQRALEGELARSVQSLSAVQSARIHLAITKPSVFARDKQQPSASVLLNLFPGRLLNEEQVSAIVHLVSSSVSNLPVKNVTIIDQHSNLLSSQSNKKSETGLDVGQLNYVKEVEEGYATRIETILSPITGPNNVRAQVTADIDFSRIERAEEIYRPNNVEAPASIRSQLNVESLTSGSQVDGGIPGALTNRPPEPANAPIEVAAEEGEVANTPAVTPTDRRTESTINYEVDKTVQHTRQSIGGVKRLSAAVVVNYRAKVDEEGNIIHEALDANEITKINNLVKEAMGYNESRGDTLTVTNNLFNLSEKEVLPETPLWKDPDMILLAKEIGKQLLIATIVLFFLLKVLRPFLRNLTQITTPVPALPEKKIDSNEETQALTQSLIQTKDKSIFRKNLEMAKQLAIEEPTIVANVVKDWVSGNGR